MDNEIEVVAPANEVRHSFEILEEKLEWFKQRMAALAKRAAKLGVEAPSYVIGETFDVPKKKLKPGFTYERAEVWGPSAYMTVLIRKYRVEVVGRAPKFAGWTFASTLQHLEDGETLVRNIAKIEAPVEYRSAGPDCQHCNHKRRRNDTFLVVHDDGTWRQVGSTCIRDFLGHDSPQSIAAEAEYLAEAIGIGCGGEESGGGRVVERIAVEDFLPVVAACMNAFGWISSKRAREELKSSTASDAWSVCFPSPMSKPLRNPRTDEKISSEVTPECTARAVAAIEWVRDLPDQGLNEYLHNCRAIVRAGAVEGRMVGYAASILIAYDKHMERVRERVARPESLHVGEVGKRERFTVTQVAVKEIDGDYGCIYLHLFSDAAGNDLRWFGSGRLWKNGSTAGSGPMADQVKDGETIEIVATVKKHDEYKGRKQTVLSRCAPYIAPLEKPKKNKETKAIAQGIVDGFQALMEPWFVANGIVDGFATAAQQLEWKHQRIASSVSNLFEMMCHWEKNCEQRGARGIEDMFRAIERMERAEAALVGDGIAAFFQAAKYYDSLFPGAMGHPSTWTWNRCYYPRVEVR